MQKLITRLGLDFRLQADNIRRYLLQCALATVFVLFLLLILDTLTQTVLIAALGASTFIAFAVPMTTNAAPRNMIGGYLVGIVAGGLMAMLRGDVDLALHLAGDHHLVVIFGALATGLAMLLMVLTRTEHPPAAALAMGLVLNEWDPMTLVVIIIGIVFLATFKHVVRPWLRDLL